MTKAKPFLNLDLQEAYVTMVTHMRQQGRPSLAAGDWCAYRGRDGTKCAIGAIIPDSAYNPSFENDPIDLVAARLGADEHARNFLGNAQRMLHDDPTRAMSGGDSFMAGVEIGARRLADLYGLTYTPAEEPA